MKIIQPAHGNVQVISSKSVLLARMYFCIPTLVL